MHGKDAVQGGPDIVAEEDEDLILKLKMFFVVAVDVSETGTWSPPSWLWPAGRVTDATGT